MSARTRQWLAALITLFLVAGSFVSFAATGSQAQFTAANAVFLSLAGLLAIGGLVGSSWVGQRSTRPWTDPLALGVCAFAVWALASSLASGRFLSAFFGESASQVGLASAVALLAVGVYAAREADSVRSVLRYLVPLLVVAQGVWALTQRADVVDAAHAGYGNSSALGFALALALPWLLDSAIEDEQRADSPRRKQSSLTQRALTWSPGFIGRMLAAALAVIVAFTVEARLALALMVATMVWFVVCRVVQDARIRRGAFVAAAGLGAITAGLLMYFERLGRLPFDFLTIRYRLWETAYEAVLRRPWLGYGADGFFSSGASVTAVKSGAGGVPLIFADGTTDPHNLIVFVAVCFGLVGLVLVLAIMVAWLTRLSVGSRSFEVFDPAFMSVAVGFVLLLTMPVTLDILPLYALFVGVSVARIRVVDPAPPRRLDRPVRWAVLSLGVVALLVFAANAASRVQLGAVSYFEPAPFERSLGGARLWSWDPYFIHQVNASFGAMMVTEGELSSAAKKWVAMRPLRAVTLDRHNPYYALAYAQALWNAGRPTTEVVSAYRSAVDKYPSFPAAHADLALVYAQSGDLEAARGELAALYATGDPAAYPWGRTAALAQKVIDEGR